MDKLEAREEVDILYEILYEYFYENGDLSGIEEVAYSYRRELVDFFNILLDTDSDDFMTRRKIEILCDAYDIPIGLDYQEKTKDKLPKVKEAFFNDATKPALENETSEQQPKNTTLITYKNNGFIIRPSMAISLIPVEPDPDWLDYANCTGVDPDLFFPNRGESTREAKEVCRGCEVRHDCLEFALQNGEKFGIWGGMSERERRSLRRERGKNIIKETVNK